MKIYKAIGLMSGTSLDGLDIAYCEFAKRDNEWHYDLKIAKTYPFDRSWMERLAGIANETSLELMLAHVELGRLFGALTSDFIHKNSLAPDFIASHGHTVFHQPENGLTLQIGSGYEILKACRLKVVCDFRSLDVTLGGQGAPLVPIGDKLLFGNYDFCLNLGGISNISFDVANERIAFDIAPHNIVLNYLSKKLGHDFDPNGRFAETGNYNENFFRELNQLDYYKKSFPKSLGIEYVNKMVFPLIDRLNISTEDQLHTYNHHVAFQIDREIKKVSRSDKTGKLLITGGGAYNGFFLKQLRYYSDGKYQIEVPSKETIEFKEALIFAFLGVLRLRNEVNALKSVTGASQDSCTGVVLELF
jgi:anhydro-N-acetylmuramic acid kinase